MLADLVRRLESQSDRFVADLATTVNTDCATLNKLGVDAVGRLMHARLAALGCAVDLVPDARYGDHVVGRLRGRGHGRVLLLAHLDTVFPPGTPQQRPFRIEGKRAFGPGVYDDKAGVLTGYYALHALNAVGFDDFAEITLLLNSEEELGSPSSQPVVEEEGRRADAVLVLEGARFGGKIVSARKGVARYDLTVTGRAAHAGVEPEAGRSAILEIAHKVIAIHALSDPNAGTTVNVGTISGGTALNIVPAMATAEVDVRVFTMAEIDRLEAAFRELTRTAVVPDTATTIRHRLSRPPFEKGPGVVHLLDLARPLAAELGFDLVDIATGGGSDGNFTAALGVPTLDGLGPDGGGAHSEREYVELASLVPRTALVAGLIIEILRTPPPAPLPHRERGN